MVTSSIPLCYSFCIPLYFEGFIPEVVPFLKLSICPRPAHFSRVFPASLPQRQPLSKPLLGIPLNQDAPLGHVTTSPPLSPPLAPKLCHFC